MPVAARPTRTRPIHQPGHTLFGDPAPPLANLCGDNPTRSAIPSLLTPSSANSPTLARVTSRCSLVEARTIRSSSARCSPLNTRLVGFLATTAPILIDNTDGALFATKIEVPVL
jgi:hypothetical protein